jgi:DUF1707 SHOCT-like domain/Cell wall-active antibiotics response LiaF, C-terminal
LGDLSQRVSDAEREQTVETLRGHLLAGRLSLDEFSERAELAYRARTERDLARVSEDLPVGEGGSRRKPTRFTGALFGHVARRGRLRLRRWTLAVSTFADVDLDLREAVIESPRTSVTVLATFGNVDVYVPEGIDVDVGGITILGHRREWGRDRARADAPVVRVRTVGCFGTVDVWRVPRRMRGDYGEIIRKLKAQQRQLPA